MGVSQINMALRLLQEDLQERLTKTSTLDNKVAEMNISLRSMQASLQDALNGRGSALRRLNASAEEEYGQMRGLIRETTQSMTALERSFKACSDKQVSMESSLSTKHKRLELDLQTQRENLHRLADTTMKASEHVSQVVVRMNGMAPETKGSRMRDNIQKAG